MQPMLTRRLSIIVQKMEHTDGTIWKGEANNFGEIHSHNDDVKNKITGLGFVKYSEKDESHEIRRFRQLLSGPTRE